MASERRLAPASFVLASALFFVSGALGLGYQLVWVRKAALVVGASQLALATVLSSFFLGLALGSVVVGRHLRSRRWSPLFVYGLFEAAIGAFALAFPWLFEGLEGLYGALYPWLAGSETALFLGRFALLFLLFLVPTFFMGGTLPLLLDGLVERDASVGARTSFLYGLNILGAVAGVLLTGYFALPILGMNGTSVAAGCGNFAIAAVAVGAFRATPPLHEVEAAAPESRLPAFYRVAALVSGFAAIGYQVGWARYFSLFNNASVHLTAVLLAVYLTALAVGSLLLSVLLRRGASPLRLLAWLQPLIPVLVFGTLTWWQLAEYEYDYAAGAPAETLEVEASWRLLGETVDAVFVAPLLQLGLVMFLPVVLVGMGLPALIAGVTRSSRGLRAASGSLVCWNTIGSSLGGFAAGYFLIPAAGLRGTFVLLGLLSVGLGAAAQWKLADRPLPRFDRLGYAIAVLSLVALAFLARDDLTARTIRSSGPVSHLEDSDLVDVVEGPITTAYVYRGGGRLMIGAGNVVLAIVEMTSPSSQAVQGHLPALFHPKPGDPKRVLGIALGSGQSFGALLAYEVETLDVVDISREMVDLSLRYFARYNHRLGSDERVRFHLDDGRHFVARAADASYDVVSMEPPPPTAEGVYALYSEEFYREVDRVLDDGGILMQWLPIYMLTPLDTRGIVKTQAAVFPHTFVARVGLGDFMVLSFKGEAPPRWDPAWIAERAETFRRERAVDGRRWDRSCPNELADPIGVTAMLVTGPEDIAAMEAPAIYRDDDQRLSYTSGDRQLLRRYQPRQLARLSFTALPLTPFAELARYFDGPVDVDALEEARACSLAFYGAATPRAMAEAERRYEAESEPGPKARAALELARLHDLQLAKTEALFWVARSLAADSEDRDERHLGVARYIARNHVAIFRETLRSWIEGLPPALRSAPVAVAMAEELAASDARAEGRSR